MSTTRKEAIRQLAKARNRGDLTLYLGAGVSVANGLPTWERLVLAMYFSAMRKDVRAYPNYLLAIAAWHLDRADEPLDITARKIRSFFGRKEGQFLDLLRETLYAGFADPSTRLPDWRERIVEGNATLRAVLRLCGGREKTHPVQSIITYNYDNLVEMALGEKRAQPVWRSDQRIDSGCIPVYHVHGYVPLPGTGWEQDCTAREIIFTEEQYHLAAQDAYSWNNLVQIQAMSSCTGLMIGLSLSDRNMRRLLDAVRKTPVRGENFALVQRHEWDKLRDTDVRWVEEKAQEYFGRFANSGIKSSGQRFSQIQSLIDEVQARDFEREEAVLGELGVKVIWYKEHSEIPDIVEQIVAPRARAAAV